MKEKSSIGCFSFSFYETLFIVFLILKLTHVIDWSWWWVTAPLWGGFALIVILIFVWVLISALLDLLN